MYSTYLQIYFKFTTNAFQRSSSLSSTVSLRHLRGDKEQEEGNGDRQTVFVTRSWKNLNYYRGQVSCDNRGQVVEVESVWRWRAARVVGGSDNRAPVRLDAVLLDVVADPPSSGTPCRRDHTGTVCSPCACACAWSDCCFGRTPCHIPRIYAASHLQQRFTDGFTLEIWQTLKLAIFTHFLFTVSQLRAHCLLCLLTLSHCSLNNYLSFPDFYYLLVTLDIFIDKELNKSKCFSLWNSR